MLEHDKDFNAIKIIDFGTAIVHDSDEPLTEVLGTPFYMAPEVIKKNYGSKCDIWSCGVMTCILVSGIPPFTGSDSNAIMECVCEGNISFDDEVWSDVSAECKDFITKLLTYNADDRPSAAEVLKHPWITKLGTTEVDKSASLGALDNLKKFNAGSIMKRATVAYISSQLLSKQERTSLAQVFKHFDKDDDGKLSMEEVKEGYLEYYGKLMTDKEIEDLFNAVDISRSGFIDYSEFVVAAMHES